MKIGDLNAQIPFNASGGNNQAIGALAFSGQQITISRLAAYVTQLGSTGVFQMAVLQPTSSSQSTVIGVTTVATSLTAGLFILPLTTPLTLSDSIVYHLAVYNQINGSNLGGRSTGTSGIVAPPINFRSQNLSGFTIGQSINTSDVILLSPYIAGLA
ncbi:hypothetical protein [Paenibacillus sp. sgz500958]|uniref:hypothetical protein n=1 Tax=Paenibacillus sp. sgz500958 TaxID=3242475 RepID=UPI0036D36F17